ncbi:uncharacterized protein [Periplaneta americana]|uniref:uncharacterized protein n=1 Tax=Periplaneta americana TaxID=6978 RepID=UPI0037E798E2
MNSKTLLSVVFAVCAVQISAADDLLTQIGNDIADLETKLQDISSQIDQAVQNAITEGEAEVDEIKSEIEAAIDQQVQDIQDASEGVKACAQAAKDSLDKVVESVKSQIKGFALREGLKALPWIGKVNGTINSLKSLQADLSSGLQACQAQGGLGQISCTAALIASSTAKFTEIMSAVPGEVQQGLDLLNTIVNDLKTTVPQIVQSVKTQGQAILQTEAECIKNAIGA